MLYVMYAHPAEFASIILSVLCSSQSHTTVAIIKALFSPHCTKQQAHMYVTDNTMLIYIYLK